MLFRNVCNVEITGTCRYGWAFGHEDFLENLSACKADGFLTHT